MYNLDDSPEDPWLSPVDHTDATANSQILYGENGNSLYTSILTEHNGANVYIKNFSSTSEAEVLMSFGDSAKSVLTDVTSTYASFSNTEMNSEISSVHFNMD
jgi:hypothetical protein